MRVYEELVAQSGQFEQAEKLDSMFVAPGPRLGNVVVQAEALRKGYGDRVLMDQLSFSLPPGGELHAVRRFMDSNCLSGIIPVAIW